MFKGIPEAQHFVILNDLPYQFDNILLFLSITTKCLGCVNPDSEEIITDPQHCLSHCKHLQLCFYFYFLYYGLMATFIFRRVNGYGTMKEEESLENTEEMAQ